MRKCGGCAARREALKRLLERVRKARESGKEDKAAERWLTRRRQR